MAERESPFADEWRDCLREHYKHVIREKDTSTEETLRPILEQVGFREDELSELKVLADPSAYDAKAAQTISNGNGNGTSTAADELTFKVHPAECTCAACMDTVLDAGHDDEGQPLEFPEEPDEGEGNVFQVTEADDTAADESSDSDAPEPDADPDDSDDDTPKQRSLF
jgi:hypothetical protein